MSPFSPFDENAMRRALELAARGLYTTHPNPRVGCVLARAEQIVGEGWHERAGGPHAEIVALRAAGTAAAGATAYVTLEPCSHHGRTPPCAEALVAAGVRRVIYAAQDPNPRVDGRGAERLSQAGIEVRGGLCREQAVELNIGFVTRMRLGRPWVRLKLAASLDGRTALANGASQWITGEAARTDVQHWRAASSAVLTGVGTVLSDDPQLTVRQADTGGRRPLRVVLDSRLRTPPEARLLKQAGPVTIFTASADAARRAELSARGAQIEQVAAHDGRLDLNEILLRLGEAEVNELLVEAGATLAGSLLAAELVDEWLLYLAPMIIGPQGRPLLAVPLLEDLRDARRYALIDSSRVGADLRLRLRPASPQ